MRAPSCEMIHTWPACCTYDERGHPLRQVQRECSDQTPLALSLADRGVLEPSPVFRFIWPDRGAGFEEGSLKHVPSASDLFSKLDTHLQSKPFHWRQRASSFAQHLNNLDEPDSPGSSRSSFSAPPARPGTPGLDTASSHDSPKDAASGSLRRPLLPAPSPLSQ